MKNFLLTALVFLLSGWNVFAQPDLPNMVTLSQGGINVLSWNNPYTTGITSVTIERAAVSDSGYVTIGAIQDLKKPSQYFTDANPLPGDNYYRVKILFNSNLEWFSNEFLIHVDSSLITERKLIPSKDSVEHLVSQLGVKANVPPQSNYQISQYIYTNPYNGNINIELRNALDIAYKVVFYDDKGQEVLEIPRVNEVFLVLDKRNFQKNGLYRFVVFEGEKKFTDGYVSVY